MPATKTVQLSPRVLANRRNGAKGGKARAAKHSKESIREWSSRGGTQQQAIYGSDLKKHMVNRRKTVGRYKTPVEDTILAKSRSAKPKKGSNVK